MEIGSQWGKDTLFVEMGNKGRRSDDGKERATVGKGLTIRMEWKPVKERKRASVPPGGWCRAWNGSQQRCQSVTTATAWLDSETDGAGRRNQWLRTTVHGEPSSVGVASYLRVNGEIAGAKQCVAWLL